MTIHLNSPVMGGQTFATGSITGIRGDLGLGFFRMIVAVEFVVEPAGGAVTDPDRVSLLDLTADVRAGGKLLGTFTAPIGSFPVWSYPERSNRAYINLICDLDRARLQAIEDVRAGRDLTLDISFSGRFNTANSGFSAGDNYVVNQGVWIGVLGQMGYQQTLLIEVQVPDPHEQPELAQAVTLLGQAQANLQRGHDRDAVGALRDVLEQLTLALGDDDNLDPEITRVLFGNSRSMTKADRLRVLRRALKLVMHPARHRDQVSVLIDWSRVDAIQLITMTAAFINEMGAPGARPSISEPASPDDPAPNPGG